jgi:hypothetical protein
MARKNISGDSTCIYYYRTLQSDASVGDRQPFHVQFMERFQAGAQVDVVAARNEILVDHDVHAGLLRMPQRGLF